MVAGRGEGTSGPRPRAPARALPPLLGDLRLAPGFGATWSIGDSRGARRDGASLAAIRRAPGTGRDFIDTAAGLF
ncbi:MAG: hypothetical protein LBI02_00655 [Opitutaceae bacterium]|nr:hypothetical protein [Opitutaceae bacterium]